MKPIIETFRIPSFYLPYLINDDPEGLTTEEKLQIDAFCIEHGYATCPKGEPCFSHTNDINNLGSDVYDVLFILLTKN